MSLKQADKFVKEGDYQAALEAIAAARKLDPTNPYAIAYEERVRTLVHVQQQNNGNLPQDVKDNALSPPHLEQISKLAIQQEQTSAAAISIHEHDITVRKLKEEDRHKQEELRRVAIQSKTATLLARAQQYLERNEFGRALDEISRALLLDPVNSDVHTLEQKVRSTYEEANKRKEAERIQKTQDAERQRQEQQQAERERIQREREEQHTREEEARHLAQRQKVDQYLQRSREFLGESRIQEAQNELAFVLVIDPLNAEAAELSQQMQTKQQQLREAELDLRRKKEEEEQKKSEAIEAAVRKHVENANQLAAAGAFSDALHVITRAYVLDPMSEELQKCETELISLQEESMRFAEARRITEEEQRHLAEEETHRQQDQAERDRLHHDTSVENETRHREYHERIILHLARAREHLSQRRFEGALSEVALAFLIDPFHDDVKRMEQQVLAERAEAHRQTIAEDAAPSSETQVQADCSTAIADRVMKANQFRDQHEYAKALDELAKAFILDPLDESIQQCEAEIQKEFIQFQLQRQNAEPKGNIPAQHSPNEHVQHANRFIASQSYDEALAEVALGLALHPDDPGLRKLEQAIWKLKSQDVPLENQIHVRESVDEDAPHIERLIKIHLLAAEELVKNDDFERALDELAKAFLIDPLHNDARKMEHRIRLQQRRHQQGPSQPLKLVYRGDKAAEG